MRKPFQPAAIRGFLQLFARDSARLDCHEVTDVGSAGDGLTRGVVATLTDPVMAGAQIPPPQRVGRRDGDVIDCSKDDARNRRRVAHWTLGSVSSPHAGPILVSTGFEYRVWKARSGSICGCAAGSGSRSDAAAMTAVLPAGERINMPLAGQPTLPPPAFGPDPQPRRFLPGPPPPASPRPRVAVPWRCRTLERGWRLVRTGEPDPVPSGVRDRGFG